MRGSASAQERVLGADLATRLGDAGGRMATVTAGGQRGSLHVEVDDTSERPERETPDRSGDQLRDRCCCAAVYASQSERSVGEIGQRGDVTSFFVAVTLLTQP